MVYIYNLIDAFATSGAKYVVVQGNKASLLAVPYVDNHSVGIGLALKF